MLVFPSFNILLLFASPRFSEYHFLTSSTEEMQNCSFKHSVCPRWAASGSSTGRKPPGARRELWGSAQCVQLTPAAQSKWRCLSQQLCALNCSYD